MSLNTGQVSKLLLSGVPVEKAAGVQSSHDPFETFEQLLEYEYCESIELFRRKTTVPIFSAVIYNGPLPPPVFWITVSASATFELTVAMVAHLQARLRGLPQNGENMFESDFFIDPSVTAGLNAEGSADLALGIVSFDLGANFDADFHMPFKIGVSENGVAGPEFGLCLHMMLEFYFDVCLSFFGLFDIACYGDDWDVWNDWLVGENDPICQALQADSCGQPNPKGLDPGDGGVAGGPIEPAPLNAPGNQLAIASSPDGEYQVAIGRLVNVGHGDRLDIVVRKKGGAWRWPPVAFIKPDNDLGMVREPSVVFTNNQQIALAWAQDFAWEDPTLQSGDESTMAGFNKIMRRYDVMFRLASLTEDPDGDIHLSFDSLPQRLSDDPINGDYHGDGRVCLARVPESGGLVWATWVRFETPDVLIPINPPLPNPVGEDYPDLTSRIHLRQTSIFARRIFGGTTQGPMMRVSNVDNFIDLQPDVTASPDGDVMIVWLNDSLHDDLTYQNDGRNILYSILGPGDVWTAPAPVLGNTADLPAILEPEIALGDDGRGMLVFSAAPAGASEFDSGLGTNRVLYTVKVSGVPDNPVWEEPVLVFRECETPIFARLYDIVHPETDHPEVEVEIEFGLVVNDIGAFGSRLGAGGMSVLVHNEAQSQWSQPINLTADDRVHQNGVVAFTGTEVVMINESPAVWSQGVARAPGGLQAESSTELFGTIQVGSFDAVADPAIMYCRIPGTHASPGTTIEAIVGVTNRGFARTPGGQDSLSLRVFYVSGGESTEIRSQPLPPLMPGDELFHSFELTMPRQPVRIVVEVDGVEGEMNPSDNVRDCPLGTQPPRDLQSRCFESSNGRLAVRLNWTNTGIYDAILIYRDGIQVTEIPGTEVSWVDYGTPAGIQDFHEYCVRGRFAQSLSTKAATLFENTCLDGVDPKPQFRRGDANLDGFVDISDAIGILAYQFLGTFDLRCPDSGDVNDDAVIDISDPVALLSFQFLGTAPPPAPGPDACGVDPTDDALEPCVSECR